MLRLPPARSSRAVSVAAALSLVAATLASCAPEPVLRADQIVVQASPIPSNPSAAYMTVYGGPEDAELLAVMSDYARKVEMHETIEKDGMSSMAMLDKVPIPAKSEVKFEPGGKHLMLWGVSNDTIKRGTMPFIFVFSTGKRIEVTGIVKPMGAKTGGEAAKDEHAGHDMSGDKKAAN
jgi:hypothetical protein